MEIHSEGDKTIRSARVEEPGWRVRTRHGKKRAIVKPH